MSDILHKLDVKLQKGGGCSIFTADGMLSAIISGPFDIPESLWMRFIWGIWRKFDSVSEQQELKVSILKFKEQITHVLEKRCPYYPLVRYDQEFDEPIFLEDLPNVVLWARGYYQGILLAEQFWNICIDKIEHRFTQPL